jgi:hypothetical protein
MYAESSKRTYLGFKFEYLICSYAFGQEFGVKCSAPQSFPIPDALSAVFMTLSVGRLKTGITHHSLLLYLSKIMTQKVLHKQLRHEFKDTGLLKRGKYINYL